METGETGRHSDQSEAFAGISGVKESTIYKDKTQNKNAQVGIRIRVVCVTGRHDGPLHYLGSFSHKLSRLPESNRGHRGSRAVASIGKPYYSRALYQAELRRGLALII